MVCQKLLGWIQTPSNGIQDHSWPTLIFSLLTHLLLFLSPKSRLLFPTAKQECSWFPEFAIPFQAFLPIHILNCVFSIMAGKSLKNQLKFQPTPGSYLWFKFSVPHPNFLGFSGISMVKNPPANGGDMGLIPGSGRPPEKEMATHSSILAWEITWTETGGLQSMGPQKDTTDHTYSNFLALTHMHWRRQWHPTPILLPGRSHGQRSLVGCSPCGREESDTTKRLHFHFSLSYVGEGNGNPLQCSCLENTRDGGAWWEAVYGVAQSRTRLKWLSSSTHMHTLTLLI